jgi:hypothetical protein
MILFFDRSIGTGIPRALNRVTPPVGIQRWNNALPNEDDLWIPIVSNDGWAIITKDYALHTENEAQADAFLSSNAAVFYLWSGDGRHYNATKWEMFRAFMMGFDRIVEAFTSTPRPFIYRILRNGHLRLEDP